MRKPTPRTMRKIKRRPIVLEPGVRTTSYDVSGAGGSRVDKLPPYDEYNPKHVHVARRRQATKDHKSFPRGWKVEYDDGDIYFDTSAGTATTVANGGWTTCTKISESDWTIEGSVYI